MENKLSSSSTRKARFRAEFSHVVLNINLRKTPISLWHIILDGICFEEIISKRMIDFIFDILKLLIGESVMKYFHYFVTKEI